ncbi:MAG: SH3 domain-containing protein [Pseudomonadota bacterium]
MTGLIAGALTGPSMAEPLFPKLYDVVGVASDDVLNLRAGPASSADIVGALPPDTTGVEVVAKSENDFWLQVAQPENMAWAAAGYLKVHPTDPDVLFTRKLSCGGVEPSWTLSVTQGDGAVLSRMDLDDIDLPAGLVRESPNMADRYFLDLGENHAALLAAQSCSDTMSDRIYGLSISLVVDPSKSLSGCCALVP